MTTPNPAFPYQDFLDQFEEAIYWHNAWYSRGVRHLMFNPSAADDLIAKDAYTHCKLGGFLRRFPTPPSCEDMVDQVDELHRQMHALMREALLEAHNGTPVNEDTFCEIEEAQSMFFGALHGLFRKVLEDHCVEIARVKTGSKTS